MGIQDDAAVACAAYRVTENGQTWYFTTSPGEELLDTAQTLRRYCTSTEHSTGKFISLYLQAQPITSEEYQQLMQLRMENTGEVAGVFGYVGGGLPERGVGQQCGPLCHRTFVPLRLF